MHKERRPAADRGHAAHLLVQQLQSLETAGLTHLPKPSAAAAQRTVASTAEPLVAERSPENESPVDAAAIRPRQRTSSLLDAVDQRKPALSLEERIAALEVLNEEIRGCRRCEELASSRTQTVFGVGNPQARLCFLGEAPGADEDAQGEPFVGRAGQLLNRIIAACTLEREDVYILNVLKCRPPGNRNPLPDEAAHCRAFLDRQLEIIAPEYICCLGSVAAKNLLETEAPIGRLRGKFFDYQGIPVLCTYHPAYLLRNPAAKAQVWDDMQLLMREMGIELPQKSSG